MFDNLQLGAIDIMTPLGGGALQLPIGLWEPGSLSAHKGHFGAGSTVIPFTASLVAGPALGVTSPLTFNSIGLNNHVGIYNITGSEIVTGSNIKLGALEASYNAVKENVTGLFSNTVPKKTDTAPTISCLAAKGVLGGFWTYKGTEVSSEPDNTSDIRLKKNIKRLDDSYCLNKIMELNPVSYDWREDRLPSGFLNDHRDENEMLKRQIGLIAQEVEKHIPEISAFKIINKKQYKSIRYGRLTALLVGALQEQQKEINSLKERITVLEN